MTRAIDVAVFGPRAGELEVGPGAPAVEADAWPRFWSRMLDLVLGQYAAGLTLGVVLALTAPGVLEGPLFKGSFGNVALPLLTLPLVFVIDALVLAVFGNTLGRKIAGLRVETIDNRRPGLWTCLDRNARIYVFGLGLGLPLISLFALLQSASQAQDTGGSSWDEAVKTRVYVRGANRWRTGIVATLYLVCNFAGYALQLAAALR